MVSTLEWPCSFWAMVLQIEGYEPSFLETKINSEIKLRGFFFYLTDSWWISGPINKKKIMEIVE